MEERVTKNLKLAI